MLSDEEKKAVEWFGEDLAKEKENCSKYNDYKKQVIKRNEKILNLIKKQSKEIEELKSEKETNQKMIQLAETQILGYGQGYRDGLNKETTASAIVARERENQIIYEGMKHKINMECVFKIKALIEELKELEHKEYLTNYYGTKEPQRMKEFQYKIDILQSLLEKFRKGVDI